MGLLRNPPLPALVATLTIVLWGCLAAQAGAQNEGEEGADAQAIQRGKALFNRNAVCFACHGLNGEPSSGVNTDVARLEPRPTDLRTPTNKSVRQLYLIVRYGIPGTAMELMQETAGLRPKDVGDIIAYLLALQGNPRPVDDILEQMFQPDTKLDQTILALCEAEALGDSEARDYCEHRYAKRYRDLIVGRPADIPSTIYKKIERGCTERFGVDLDSLAGCYRMEFSSMRKSTTDSGKEGRPPRKPAG